VDATLENGINYNLCFSGNYPLGGVVNAEVDIVGHLDAKVETKAKTVRIPGCTAIAVCLQLYTL
jgi:hypothetical protein